MHTPDELLGPNAAARLAGYSPHWIRVLVQQGRLPGIRTGIGTLVKREDVERLAAERAAREGADR